MPRLPDIRVSYTNDANFLFRLISAVERDTKRPVAWRKKVISMVQDLAIELSKAPVPGEQKGKAT